MTDARKESSKTQAELPHWIHMKIKDPSYTSGFKYSRECACSSCGITAPHEMPVCPGCHAKMY